jgi:23S rRNA pseudouridine955/2504/2580 synthase
MAREFILIPVTEDDEGSRLDRFIHKKYPYLNQGKIEKSLRAKLIPVNLQKKTSNYRIALEDSIQIATDLIQENYTPDRKYNAKAYINLITDNILYHDADLLVINKPAGLAVQGGSKIKISIDDIMPYVIESFGTWNEGNSPHKLVHRLDKETSGILVIALNNRTAQELSYSFKEHEVQKTYLSILSGRIKTSHGEISSIIDKEEKGIKKINAITKYKVLSSKIKASFVEFKPITGKKHQLRLHALKLGHPIYGDTKYDPSLLNDKYSKLHLHAAEIAIPYKDSMLKLKADLPEYFKDSLKQMFGITRK